MLNEEITCSSCRCATWAFTASAKHATYTYCGDIVGMQMRQTWRFECRCLLVIPCELSIVEHEVSRAENPFAILGYVRLDHLQSTVCLSTMITADAAESLRRALLLRTVDCANRFQRARKHTIRCAFPFLSCTAAAHCRCTLPLHTAAAHCRCRHSVSERRTVRNTALR